MALQKRERSILSTQNHFAHAPCTALLVLAVLTAMAGCVGGNRQEEPPGGPTGAGPATDDHSPQTLSEGQRVFRFETFGDEEFWTDKARHARGRQQSVSPTMALKVGLKVDAEAIPADVAAAIKSGKVDLESPATTVTLLKLNAVVGTQGHGGDGGREGQSRSARDHLRPLPFHRRRLVLEGHRAPPGWVAQPRPQRRRHHRALSRHHAGAEGGLQLVGAGKYDPRYNLDGKSTPLVLPPAYGLAKVKNETYTAEGPISYWNAYVAVTQMHGHGNFSDPRLKIEVKNTPDMVTPMLPALAAYQHSLPAPRAPGRDVRCRRGGARPSGLRSVLHELPRGHEQHRQQRRNAAPALRNGNGWRLRGPHGQQGVPDDAASRALAASSVLPRWKRRHSRRGRRPLRSRAKTLADHRAEERPRPVPEVALRAARFVPTEPLRLARHPLRRRVRHAVLHGPERACAARAGPSADRRARSPGPRACRPRPCRSRSRGRACAPACGWRRRGPGLARVRRRPAARSRAASRARGNR